MEAGLVSIAHNAIVPKRHLSLLVEADVDGRTEQP